jgi:hypothetical protein
MMKQVESNITMDEDKIESILRTPWTSSDGIEHIYGTMEPRHLFYSARMLLKRMEGAREIYREWPDSLTERRLIDAKQALGTIYNALQIRGIRRPLNVEDNWTGEDEGNAYLSDLLQVTEEVGVTYDIH